MDERVKFIGAYLRGEISLTRLCEAFGVSRKTGYKWLDRYSAGGVLALNDRSRRPHGNPRSTATEIVELIVAARKKYPFWGPKKLGTWLHTTYPGLALPAQSTMGEILKRHGLVVPRRPPARRSTPYTQPFLGYDRPNAVWCADFKGDFAMSLERRCYPLTISDGFSRYLLRCEGLSKTRERDTRPVFESAFKEFGLPYAIRTDNGPPFSSNGLAGLSQLAVWWIRLGIRPERIQPGHPQQNGRHERMHRTLKAETAKPPQRNMKLQQAAFDTFRARYNQERPHEALGQRTPASVYSPSPRPYPAILSELEYPSDYEVRTVTSGGELRWGGTLWYLSWNLSRQQVALKHLDDKRCLVYFGPLELGVLDQATRVKIAPGRKPTGKLRPSRCVLPLPHRQETAPDPKLLSMERV
jgi:transposase InsO family protein